MEKKIQQKIIDEGRSEELAKKEDKETGEKMEIDTSMGEEVNLEEEVLRKLLEEWKHLDERFIPEQQKKLYRETFQQYQEKQGKGKLGMVEKLGLQQDNTQDIQSKTKGGKKRGRKNIQESIQLMGEMLVNIGRVVPLSAIFHQTNPTIS